MITIDFETRSRLDIRRVGSYEYAHDPSTGIICLAWKIDEGPVFVWSPILGDQVAVKYQPLIAAIRSGALLEAHNAFFERCIWEAILVPRFGFPPIAPDQWRCSMAKAAAVGLPQSLEVLAVTLGCKNRKDQVGNSLMTKLSKPTRGQPTLFDCPLFPERPEDVRRVCEYCVQDVETEHEASSLLPELTDRELAIWQLDQEINARGIGVDRRLCFAAKMMIEELRDERDQELIEITGGVINAAAKAGGIKTWLEDQDFLMPSIAVDPLRKALARDDVPGVVRRVLEIRQETALSSVAKFDSLLNRSAHDGRLRGSLRYCGAAQTGRWSGSGAQPHNFPRGSAPYWFGGGDDAAIDQNVEAIAQAMIDGDRDILELSFGSPMEAAKELLRPSLVAAPGSRFLIWDFAQIEARGLAWLAGETELLELFAQGGDPYKTLAAEIYGKSPVDVTGPERSLGKIGILGLGYQMGSLRFRSTLKASGIGVSADFADRIVRIYREKFPKIVALWWAAERAARQALLSPGEVFHVPAAKPLSYKLSGDWLDCNLPSDRVIRYFRPELYRDQRKQNKRQDSDSIRYRTAKNGRLITAEIYAGKFVENVVQAISRDVLADSMLRLRDLGLKIVLTVHDEIIAEVPWTDTEIDVDFGERVLAKSEEWSRGFPIKAEGFSCSRYRKG